MRTVPVLTPTALRRWSACGFTYFGLAYYSQGVIAALQAARGDVARTIAGETNLPSTVAQALIAAGLIVALAREPRRYLSLYRPLLPLICIASLALLSVMWSADPVRTARRSLAFAECVLFGVFLYCTAGLERTIARVGRVAVAMAVLSLVVFVVAPGIGRETALGYERAMRGVFPQKNPMSECMLLGLCCFSYHVVRAPRKRDFAAVSLLVVCMVLGRGASALLVAVVLGVLTIWFALQGRAVGRLGVLFLAAWSLTALSVMLLVFPQELFALAGRDLSLTGRVPLWQALLPEIARAPLLGYGYAGFWNADTPRVQMIWRYAGWEAPDAHSSVLDILLQLGAVGLGLYFWLGLRVVHLARRAARTGFGPAAFVVGFGLTLLLTGLDEGVIAIPNAWTALLPVCLLALWQHMACYERRTSSS